MEKKKNKLSKKTSLSTKTKIDFEIGSENIFADLEFERPEEELAKAELAIQIYKIIKQKKLTQIQAASVLGVDQAKVSALMTGKLAGFSMERLFRFLNDLGQDIAIKVSKARTRKKGSTTVDSYKRVRPDNIPSQSKRSQSHGLYAKKRG